MRPTRTTKTRFEPTRIARETFVVHDHQGEGTEPVSVALHGAGADAALVPAG